MLEKQHLIHIWNLYIYLWDKCMERYFVSLILDFLQVQQKCDFMSLSLMAPMPVLVCVYQAYSSYFKNSPFELNEMIDIFYFHTLLLFFSLLPSPAHS